MLWVLVDKDCELPFTRGQDAAWIPKKDSACGSHMTGLRVREGELTRTPMGLALRLSTWTFIMGTACEATLRGTWTAAPAEVTTP